MKMSIFCLEIYIFYYFFLSFMRVWHGENDGCLVLENAFVVFANKGKIECALA